MAINILNPISDFILYIMSFCGIQWGFNLLENAQLTRIEEGNKKMLEVEHVSESKDHQVLVDINLKVNQGDMVVILGPSGSGKNAFLRCLNHLEKRIGRLTLGGKV